MTKEQAISHLARILDHNWGMLSNVISGQLEEDGMPHEYARKNSMIVGELLIRAFGGDLSELAVRNTYTRK